MNTHEKLVALANAKNSTNVPADCVKLQNMQPYPEGGTAYNTTVDVVGILDKGYSGTTQLHYNRIAIDKLFTGYSISITVPWGNVTTPLVVSELNKLYPALEFDPAEFQIALGVAGTPIFTLSAKSDSMIYTGIITVAVDYVLTDISTDLTVTKLQGFEYLSE